MLEVPGWSWAGLPETERGEASRSRLPEGLRLLALSGADRGREIKLGYGTFHVGKHPRCDLVLTDAQVSRRHLELRIDPTGVHARDLGSRNGSYFRRARFSELVLQTGAIIRIGSTDLVVLSDESGTPLLPSAAPAFGKLIGGSLAMRNVFAILERAAPTDVPVLIDGETGSGKEVCAEAIHEASGRKHKPLVVCDMSALAPSLIESELFGHARGAFTGAVSARRGAFESASGSTLFLDEIGELRLDLQPRLLRALDRQQIVRVGETRARRVDVRVIAATNRDLAAEVKAGRFREDLFHRLSVVRVRLPPLRERKEDLAQLVEHRGVALLPETLALLDEYDWPGNVRELYNILERAQAVATPGQPLTPADLGVRIDAPDAAPVIEDFHLAKEQAVARWERAFLTQLRAASGDNMARAARESGLGRTHLYRLLKKHGMTNED